MKTVTENDIYIEALVRALAMRDMTDRTCREEYFSLVLGCLPEGSTLLIGVSSDGKLTGHAELSKRGMSTTDRIEASLFGALHGETAFVMSARILPTGSALKDEYDLARSVFAVCRGRNTEYRDHAVFTGGKWRYIISEFRDFASADAGK